MIVEAIDRVARKVVLWSSTILDRRRDKRMLRAFPVGQRVILTAACPCARAWFGKTGTVLELGYGNLDYRVAVDGGTDKYEFICGKGMVRA